MTAISDLDIFARVARTGNMSAAGREMGLSPAVISKRISLLEERLGARLFQRTTRHLTLTETGEGYFKRVVDILSLIEEAEDFPDIELDFHLTDNFVDIIREGFDVAIRIGELQDSSLVARKLAPDNRIICAAPSYLERHGTPNTLGQLENHVCLSAGAQEVWRLEGPEGQQQLRVKGNIRSNSSELVREALLSGLGIGLRGTWEVGKELASGALQVVLPQYRGSSSGAIWAVYPSREFMPAKVNAFIEFLAEIYGVDPYWDKGIEMPPSSRKPIKTVKQTPKSGGQRLAAG